MSMIARWLAAAGSGCVGATEAELSDAESRLQVRFPTDYRKAMLICDGSDAEFSSSWLARWKVKDLIERNAGYEASRYAPGLTFFGSDGDGEAYAWDWRAARKALYIVTPFIAPDPDVAVPCVTNFEEFLAVLYAGVPFTQAADEQ